ncbi:MAG: hypothetical protein P1U40_13475 [Coxiellaceae bacterium]|nr:hypothetical protein [Coxiellaceae bacterium]
MKTRSQFYFAFLCIVLTTSIFALAFGKMELWFLLWLLPLPAMLYSQIATIRRTIFVSLLSYIIGCTAVIFHRYLLSVYPVPFALIPSLLHGMVFTMIIVLFRISLDRLPVWLQPFVFPTFWTGYQLIWSYTDYTYFIHFGLSTQAYFLPLLQLTSLTGIWGISFVLCLFSSSIATAIYHIKTPLKALIPLAIGAIIIGAVLGFGYHRLAQPEKTRHIRVALGAHNPPHMHQIGYPSKIQMAMRIQRYPKLLEQMASMKPLFMLTPEIWLQLNDNNTLSTLHTIKQIAKQTKTNIIAAIKLLGDQQPKVNAAWLINQQGKLEGQYNKIHLIPEVENNLVAGDKMHTFTLNGVNFGVAIGDDPLFQQPIHSYGKLNGQIVFIASADNGIQRTGRELRQIAIMHAVGNGLALARSATFGELTLADAYGHIIANMPTTANATTVLTADVPLGFGNTFHSRYGNWFSWVCLAFGLLILLLLAWTTRKDHNSAIN